MGAEHEKLGSDHCAGNGKNTNSDISTLPGNEESEPMECCSNALDYKDVFSVVLRELEALARLNGFMMVVVCLVQYHTSYSLLVYVM